MSLLALSLSLTFAVAALRMENRRELRHTRGMLIPTVWYVLAVSKPVDCWLNPSLLRQASQDYMEGSANNRIVLAALIVCGLLVLLTRSVDWTALLRRNGLLCLLLVFMLSSLAWSGYRYIALKRFVRLLGDLVMVMVVMTERDPLRATRKMVLNTGYLLVPLSIVLAKYFPLYGREYSYQGTVMMWAGVASQKNGLGIYCAVVVLTVVSAMVDDWPRARNKPQFASRIALLLLTIYMLVGGGEAYPSATALAVVPIGIVVFLLALRSGSTPQGRDKFTAILLVVSALVLLVFRTPLRDDVFRLLGRDPTMTGRDVIWSGLIEIGMEHPVAGVGFGSFWMRPLFGENEAHNGYIEIFLQLGIVGIILTVVFLIAAYWRMWNGDPHGTAFRLMIFVVILLQNYSEASLLRANTSAGIMFLLVCVSRADLMQRRADTAIMEPVDTA